MKLSTLSLWVGLLPLPAMACDLCAIYSAAEAQGQFGTGLFAGAAEQFTHFGSLQMDGHRVPNPTGQYVDSSISQVFVGYQFNHRASAQFTLPIIHRTFKRPEGLVLGRGSESGLGDVSLIGNFRIIQQFKQNSTFNWSVIGGVKFPTGSSDRIREEFNETEVTNAPLSGIHGHDLTLGSGSFDGIVGTSVSASWKRCFATAGAQYAIRSEGDFDYRFANDLTWTGGPGVYLLLGHTQTLALQAMVAGEHKGTDTFQGESAEDTGVTSVYLGPQLNYTWSSKLSAQLGVDVPVSVDNTALQAVPDYRIRAALQCRF